MNVKEVVKQLKKKIFFSEVHVYVFLIQLPADSPLTVLLQSSAGLQMIEGASIDVPVVFAPNTMELKQAWICITMKPLSSPGNSHTFSTGSVKRVYVSHYLSERFIFLSSRLSAY